MSIQRQAITGRPWQSVLRKRTEPPTGLGSIARTPRSILAPQEEDEEKKPKIFPQGPFYESILGDVGEEPGGGPDAPAPDDSGIEGSPGTPTPAAAAMGFSPNATPSQTIGGFFGAISPRGILGLVGRGALGSLAPYSSQVIDSWDNTQEVAASKGSINAYTSENPTLGLGPADGEAPPGLGLGPVGSGNDLGVTSSPGPDSEGLGVSPSGTLGQLGADPSMGSLGGPTGGAPGGIGGGQGQGHGDDGSDGGPVGSPAGDDGGEDGSSVCIIITACTSRDAPEVQITREYRDKFLDAPTLAGYYLIAAFVVPVVKKFAVVKWMVRNGLVERIVDYGAYALEKRESMKYRTSRIVAQKFLGLCRILGRGVMWASRAARLEQPGDDM